ncbi:hypothetical protein WOLCODRAFT_61848 [Wolfiporia cocos MD-104 SS10]|uniref:Uncharacterized protein n=1 Tax=Wolfiporia cocos (strain MD-104) TaxID=742152 RepID=A0A2H3ISP3_WOLCO|nr:hypothetical protein WOLCODRAFT_61848 [Wolfiporia cocos MD-104 SS10]
MHSSEITVLTGTVHLGYIGQEFPSELPLRLGNVAMSFETMPMNGHYSQTGFNAWLEWHAIDHFPKAHGFVALGANGRQFGISMFHQLHCLEMIRESMINGPDGHAAHCLNFLRQAILCNSDITLESGGESTHVCRDWTQVYAFVTRNQLSSSWPTSNSSVA